MRERETGTSWLWAFAPINASVGIFFTLLPLYILNLGGNVVDVGVITSAYLLSLVPGALVWGYIIEYFPHRKGYIAFSYIGMGAILAIIYSFNRLGLFSFFLAFYGFVSAAAAPAVSLLIMESFAKRSWPDMVAKLSFASMIGYDAGIITGFLWTSFYKLDGLIALSALLSMFSGALVLKLVREPKLVFERKAILFSRELFTHRLRVLPVLIFGLPTLRQYRRFLQMLRLTFLREVPLLYFSVFIFDLGANIFGTSYVPALKQNYISDNEIFLITLSNSVTQTVAFLYIHRKRFFERYMVVDSTEWVLAIRAAIFLTTTIIIALFRGGSLMAINLIVFSAIGGSWAFYNTAVSSLVFRTLDSQRQGEILGIYSSIGGLFSFTGALASGYLSYTLGYSVTFLAAGTLMVVSLYLLNLSAKIGERVRLLHDIITYG